MKKNSRVVLTTLVGFSTETGLAPSRIAVEFRPFCIHYATPASLKRLERVVRAQPVVDYFMSVEHNHLRTVTTWEVARIPSLPAIADIASPTEADEYDLWLDAHTTQLTMTVVGGDNDGEERVLKQRRVSPDHRLEDLDDDNDDLDAWDEEVPF